MSSPSSLESAWEVVVVGAGPAGMLAAVRAAQRGRRTLLLEKNRRPGVKILMSGGTRCNLTHDTDARGIIDAFGPSGRFLHSALAGLSPRALVDLVEAEGVPLKVEPGGKVFPVSDRALDVWEAFRRLVARSGCQVSLDEPLLELERSAGGFRLTTSVRTLQADHVVLTTGGRSYPGCGTTGDGYRWAAALGHTIVTPRVALVPITTRVPWVPALQGVTVPDVLVQVLEAEPSGPDHAAGSPARETCLAQYRGSFLFAHFGLSGPAVLNVSRAVSGHADRKRLALVCNFLPALSGPQLDAQLRQHCAAAGKKQLSGLLDAWLPRRLAEALLGLANVPPDRRAAEFSKTDRQRLVHAIQQQRISVTGTLGFEKAEVTAGGVALDEVDSRTMQSQRVPGLYIAGELLDLDGPIGGYNFQSAFSTGSQAGDNV